MKELETYIKLKFQISCYLRYISMTSNLEEFNLNKTISFKDAIKCFWERWDMWKIINLQLNDFLKNSQWLENINDVFIYRAKKLKEYIEQTYWLWDNIHELLIMLLIMEWKS